MTEEHYSLEPAEANSLDSMFYPLSVAVIGAGQDPRAPQGLPVPMLSNQGFEGEIYPVNPKYQNVYGFTCYPSVKEIPGEVDLAIIAVRAERVMERLEECKEKGVKAVIIFSSGFAEIGEEGTSMQQELTDFARKTGMRILGPNCLGLLNYYNGNLSTFFFHQLPSKLAHPLFFSFITQSGGLGSMIYQMIVNSGIGFNYFISTGNEADVSFAEVLEYLVGREEVSMIGGYLEGLAGQGKKFVHTCEEALQNGTLITMLKMGRTPEGAEAASSHTGALVGEDRAYDAVFKQKGVVRVEEVEEMSALTTIYAAGRIPRGNRIGIITVSGGGGVVVADKCPSYGLEVVGLEEGTRASLQEFFPTFGATRNPVDLTSQIMVQPALFQRTIHLVMNDPQVDVGVFFYDLDIPNPEATQKIIDVYHELKKPLIVFSWPTGQELAEQAKNQLIDAGVPVISQVSRGLWAISALVDWQRKVEQASLRIPEYLPESREDKERVSALQVVSGEGVLTESRSKNLLSAYGIPITREILINNAQEAVKAAEELQYPVVLKVESPEILHKSDVGGVKLNLKNSEDVARSYYEIMESVRVHNPQAGVDGLLVQEMISSGLEVIVGVKRDPLFGPLVMFGLGGVLVEVLGDVSMRLAPLSRYDAQEMIREIKGYPLLQGTRGQSPRDLRALEDIILKVSKMAVDLEEELEEMDINPLLLLEEGKGAVAADALIKLGGKQASGAI